MADVIPRDVLDKTSRWAADISVGDGRNALLELRDGSALEIALTLNLVAQLYGIGGIAMVIGMLLDLQNEIVH